jgi:CMP-N,N'-diacetyllegionaminic acid synthase|tara:strand:+ start:88 stop:750 length:663 start_codon:yes stop_codon:yes gene_type:complete
MVKYLAIIPARKNSKRLKNKNIIKIKNRILFDYTLIAAKKSSMVSAIAVTTDIKFLLKKDNKRITYIKRPFELSLDHCSTESAILHCLAYLKKKKIADPENIILLQPTSPCRNRRDIDESINFFENGKFDSLFSAYEDKLSIWKNNNNKYFPTTYKLKKRKREQDTKPQIIENGAIYIFNYQKFLKHKVRLFGKIGCFFMNKKNSLEIDDKFDLNLVKKI